MRDKQKLRLICMLLIIQKEQISKNKSVKSHDSGKNTEKTITYEQNIYWIALISPGRDFTNVRRFPGRVIEDESA
jgi:hypothetical protein